MYREKYNIFLQKNAEHLSNIIQTTLPESSTKDYMLWLLAKPQYQEDYLRMMGVAGSIELELHLLEHVLSEVTTETITPFINHINAYFAYETLSDNLAVGLTKYHKKSNSSYSEQKKILLHFNQLMQQKLQKPKLNLNGQWQAIDKELQLVSVNKKTLSPQQMDIFEHDYLRSHVNAVAKPLEYSYVSILILNIETCLRLLDSLAGSPVQDLLKQSLIARYKAVTNIVNNADHVDRETLAAWGIHSILTIPTLAYCIGALDKIKPNPELKKVIDSGLLYQAMAESALLTRLLNDMGTRLLTMTSTELECLFNEFSRHYKNSRQNSIFEFLKDLSEQIEYKFLLTRIRKDLLHGEFNVCLDMLNNKMNIHKALTLFSENIVFYANLYQTTQQSLDKHAKHLTLQLGSPIASKVITNFANFHAKKYNVAFDTEQGDYAVSSKRMSN